MAQVDSAAMSFPAYNEAIITRAETTERQENKALTDKYYCIFLLRFNFLQSYDLQKVELSICSDVCEVGPDIKSISQF